MYRQKEMARAGWFAE